MYKIKHTAFNGYPVVELLENNDSLRAVYIGRFSKRIVKITKEDLYQKEFPLSQIINDYFIHLGSEAATKLLIKKQIINTHIKEITL